MAINIDNGIVTAVPSGAAGGDLAGTYPNPTVESADSADALKSATGTVDTSAATAPSAGQVLKATDGTHATWQDESGAAADASTTVKGVSKLSTAPVSSSNPIAVGDNDTRMSNSRAPSGSAGGSLSGTYPNPAVAKIQAVPVDTASPNDGDVLTYVTADSKAEWVASAGGPPSGSAGGDLSGTYPNPTVAALQGTDVDNTPPSDGQVLTYVTADSKAEWQDPAGGGGGISGSGTSGQIPKFTGSTAIGDSIITEDTGKIGVNTITPKRVFHVHVSTDENVGVQGNVHLGDGVCWVSTSDDEGSLLGLEIRCSQFYLEGAAVCAGGLKSPNLALTDGNSRGTATLSSGTVTVACNLAHSTSVILVTYNTISGTPGILRVANADMIDGTSFVITSSTGALDNSTVNWLAVAGV